MRIQDMQRATKPSDQILAQAAPLKLWEQAERQAKRSPLIHHRTGAIIFDRHSRVLATGCSHAGVSKSRWTHAEEFACSRMWPAYSSLGAHCLIVTLTRGGGWAWSSRPCAMCLNKLNHFNVQYATYAERCNDGSWETHSLIVSDLMHKVREVDLSAQYAKAMRI